MFKELNIYKSKLLNENINHENNKNYHQEYIKLKSKYKIKLPEIFQKEIYKNKNFKDMIFTINC